MRIAENELEANELEANGAEEKEVEVGATRNGLNGHRKRAAAPSPERPHRRIEPDKGLVNLNLREIWRFRDLLWTLAGRDVKLRYRQTALGVLWVVLQPLLGAGILSFVFNTIAGLPTDGVSPFAFSFAGMLGYTVFSSILTKASTSLVQNSQMVSKVYFPRLILPISVTFSSFLDFFVGLGVMLLLLWFNHIALTPALLLIPLWLVLISMLALGCGLFFGALMVSYRDVQYVVPVLIGLLNFASPVAYPVAFVLSKLSPSVHPFYFLFNPLAALLSAFRWSILGQGSVEWSYVAFSAIVSITAFLVGAYAFKSLEGRLADVI